MSGDQPRWDESTLLALIRDKVKEGPTLEYKSANALRPDGSSRKDDRVDELTRDVTAMANAAGGAIVYGIVETEHLPSRLDQGFDPREARHEWIENIVGACIQPRIRGLKIHRVPLSTTSPGREALVVEVPAGETAHQAKDLKYYQRQNFSRPAMEDYQIRDVMFRVKHPRVELAVDVGPPAIDHPDPFSLGLDVQGLTFRLRNDGTNRAKDLRVELTIPTIYFQPPAGAAISSPIGQLRGLPRASVTSRSIALACGQQVPGNLVVFEQHGGALFPGQEILLFSRGKGMPIVHLYVPAVLQGEVPDVFVHWRVFADDAPMTESQLVVREGTLVNGKMPVRGN